MVTVAVFNAHRRYRIARKPAVRHVRRVLRVEGTNRGTIAVIFVDTRFITKMNRRFLEHDDVTDVISFPLHAGGAPEGEIYVCLDQARKQAMQVGVSFTQEVARLVIHGTLHLLGYDDVDAKHAKRMRTVEDGHVRHWFPSSIKSVPRNERLEKK